MTPNTSPHFWRNHFYLPLAAFILFALIIEFGGVDMYIADQIYAWEGGRWALKDAWLTSKIIHILGRNISICMLLVVVVAWAQSYATQKLKLSRRELVYLLCAVGGGSALVSIIKSLNHASCAWDFSRYGGKAEYATVFSEFLHGHGNDCFPAGHASGGYAWIAFYFVGVHLQSRWRWAGLAFALGVGLTFGISQQMRGAHFISHDLWTLGICWFFSLLIYRLMLANHTQQKNTI